MNPGKKPKNDIDPILAVGFLQQKSNPESSQGCLRILHLDSLFGNLAIISGMKRIKTHSFAPPVFTGFTIIERKVKVLVTSNIIGFDLKILCCF
jgi:hypothetical protein